MTLITAFLRAPLVVAALALSPVSATAASTGDAPAPAAEAAGTPIMTGARIVGDAKRTRFIADLDQTVAMTVFTLADPYRIIVDLPDVAFRFGEDAGKGRGLISAFRYGLISAGKSRIVIDLTEPVKIDKSFVLDSVDAEPARVVIDVVPTSRTAFLATARAFRETKDMAANERHQRELRPSVAPSNRLKVVLDPGHGGIDTGAKGDGGALEKDVTLAFAKVLGEKLKATGLYDVIFTRDDDTFVSLGGRVALARAQNADLLISMHANSFFGDSVRGAIIYTISDKASDKMAEQLAAKENEVDVLAGVDIGEDDSDDVKDILVDLTRRETRNFGVVLAQNLIKEMKSSTKMFKVPHQTAGFKVLEAPDVPSAMIELGYLSNKSDEKLMQSDEWRQKTADSVVRAVAAYFRTKVARSGE
jgi:N-acetylmuramoyl-L-alanine amidase